MNTIATVKDLIEYLEGNFKEDDMLCFFHEGGAWCEVEHIEKSMIGDNRWMFNYVMDKRQYELDNPGCHKDDVEHMREIIKENYRFVKDDGVVIY